MPKLGQAYAQRDVLSVSLGALFLKSAAVPPGVQPGAMYINDAAQGGVEYTPSSPERFAQGYIPRVQQQGEFLGGATDYARATGFSPGLQGGDFAGQASPFGLLMQGMQGVDPMFGALAAIGPMAMEAIQPGSTNSPFFKNREMYWAGGNPDKIKRFQESMAKIRQINAGDVDQSMKRHLGDLLPSIPDSAISFIVDKATTSKDVIHSLEIKAATLMQQGKTAEAATITGYVSGLQDPARREASLAAISAAIKTNPTMRAAVMETLPNLGGLVQTFGAVLPPELKTALQMIMPRVALDMKPLQDAVLTVTNGKPDADLLDTFAADFSRFYERASAPGGALEQAGVIMPKSQALETFAFFKRTMPNGTEAEFANIAKGAFQLTSQLGLKSTGQAMLLMSQLGVKNVASDPAKMQDFISQTTKAAAKGDLNIQQLMQATEIAAKTGRNVNEVIAGAGHAAVVSKALAGIPQSQQIAQRYAEAAGKISSSRTGAIFAAALQAGGGLQAMAEQVQKTGDPVLAEKVLRAGRSNMRVMQLAKTLPPEVVNNALQGASTSAIMVAGSMAIAKRIGVPPRDLKLLSDPKFLSDYYSGNGKARLSAAGNRFMQMTQGAGAVAMTANKLMSQSDVIDKTKAKGWGARQQAEKARKQVADSKPQPAPANSAAKIQAEEQTKAPTQAKPEQPVTPTLATPATPPPAPTAPSAPAAPAPSAAPEVKPTVSAQTPTAPAGNPETPAQPKPWDEQIAQFASAVPGVIGTLGAGYLGAKRAG